MRKRHKKFLRHLNCILRVRCESIFKTVWMQRINLQLSMATSCRALPCWYFDFIRRILYTSYAVYVRIRHYSSRGMLLIEVSGSDRIQYLGLIQNWWNMCCWNLERYWDPLMAYLGRFHCMHYILLARNLTSVPTNRIRGMKISARYIYVQY